MNSWWNSGLQSRFIKSFKSLPHNDWGLSVIYLRMIFFLVNFRVEMVSLFDNREKLKNRILCRKKWRRLGDLSADSNLAKPLLISLRTCRTYQILCLTSDMKHLNHYKFLLMFFCQEASVCRLWSSLFFYLFFLPIDKNIIRIWIYFFLFCYHFLLRKIYHILSIFFIIFLTK